MGESRHDEKLQFTGERFIPGTLGEDPRLRAEHLLRYAACGELVRGKRVLDIACGDGYGSAMLAASASRVLGLDISADAVKHASSTYAGIAKLGFETASATSLPCEDECFDVVVSFETIEHLSGPDQSQVIHEVHRVLRRDGLLVASTPNATNYAKFRDEPNPFHLHELDRVGFLELLQPLTVFSMYCESMMAFMAVWSAGDETYTIKNDLVPDPLDGVYLIAVAGREHAVRPEASMTSLWYDPRLSYAATVQSLVRWARDADSTIAERDKAILSLQEEFEIRTAWALQLNEELTWMKSTFVWRVRRALRDPVRALRAIGRKRP